MTRSETPTPPAERETVCLDCVQGWSHHESCMGWHTSDEERATIGHCMQDCGADECYKICSTCDGNYRIPVNPDTVEDEDG